MDNEFTGSPDPLDRKNAPAAPSPGSLPATPPDEDSMGARVHSLTDQLLALTRELTNQGVGTPRKELTVLAQQIENLARALASTQVTLTGVLEREHVAASPMGGTYGWENEPDRPHYKDLTDYLVQTLRITPKDAKQRISLAAAMRPAPNAPLNDAAPAHPRLTESLRAGELSLESATIILDTTENIAAHPPTSFQIGDQVTDPVAWATETEHTLCEQARTFGPTQLRRIGKHCEILANPDGTEPTPRELARHQGITYKGRHHKLHHFHLALTDTQTEQFTTSITAHLSPTRGGTTLTHPTSAPQANNTENTSENTSTEATGTTDAGGTGVGSQSGGPGFLAQYALPPTPTQIHASETGIAPTHAQKLLDIMLTAIREGSLHLATATRENTGEHYVPQARQTVIAIINHHDLTPEPPPDTTPPPEPPGARSRPPDTPFYQRTGPTPPSAIQELACNATIHTVTLSQDNQPLNVGRAQRFFTPAQRIALNARDKGCVFPGCTTPLAFCEAHHITPWSHGGHTNLNNGALLCPYHHHYIHTGTWTLTITNNTPTLTPPPWIDPHQQPQTNTIHTLHT